MEREFEAPDSIEVMAEVTYNRFLIDELVGWSEGARCILDFAVQATAVSRSHFTS